ncbi:MarR family transcriptional regulator [Nocardioides sp.]|uniref:MarR family winged helix-turn-helix transcriptional regulator n=1 Tax=Nocardioides sp. TaxID=35761 RepID=UPI001A2470FF|nr:MarR family transcriptional regulator [Nocardioides sp.]MBJ7356757.1 MarR family transcriptional regulator [Nocardioides sp.]
MSESPWLSAEQQSVWRSWLALSALLPAALHRQLARDSGLSLPDFDVLVQLSESPAGRLRVADLARALTWERSRASHHLTRMQKRGLVDRQECADDGRGAFVVLTPEGRAAIEQAAPPHAATVKDLVFADLDDDELEVLGRVVGKICGRLEGRVLQTPA